MFPRVRVSGAWTNGTTVPGSQWEQFDENLSHAIDGLNGGAYALAADLVIGGDPGVQITFGVELELQDNLSVAGTASFYGDLIATGDAYLGNVRVSGETEFTQDVLFSGGGATFDHSVFFNHNVTLGDGSSDDIIVNGALDCTAVAAFRDTVQFDEDVDFNGVATFNGNIDANGNCFLGSSGHVVELAGAIELRGPLTMQSTGAIAHRAVAGDDSTTTYSPLAVHEVVMEAGVLTGSTDWNIDDTGCVNGNEILFTNKDGSASIDVRRPGGSLIKTLTSAWGRFVRIAGVWQLAQYGEMP